MSEKKHTVQAYREMIQGYYARIHHNPDITVEDIMQMLEEDMEFIRKESLVIDAEDILQPQTTLTEQEEAAMDGIEWPVTLYDDGSGGTITCGSGKILMELCSRNPTLANLICRLLNQEQERRKL